MAHLHRFYLPGPLAPDSEYSLSGEEAHHALHVVRLRPGDTVALINGRGSGALGSVTSATRHDVHITTTTVDTTPPPAHRLTLLPAALHSPKATEFLVRHGAELGVHRFHFFRARHSERPLGSIDKLERVAIEAMKQSGRRWLPEFETADSLEDALTEPPGPLAFLAMDTPPTPWSAAASADTLTLAIGPEGDFAPEETALLLQRGALPLSLGPYTYRSEVATTLAAALIQHHWSQLGPV